MYFPPQLIRGILVRIGYDVSNIANYTEINLKTALELTLKSAFRGKN